jgi:bacterioferritin-associated ferredoxin
LILCVCNALRESDVVAAARDCRTRCPRRAYAALGAEPQCGQCLEHAEALLIAAEAEALQPA